MKFRVRLPIYTHESPSDPEVLKQLHINRLPVTYVTTETLLIVTGSKDEISEVLFWYHDRDLEAAAHDMMYAEVLSELPIYWSGRRRR